MASRNYDTLLDYDNDEEKLSYQQQTRQREEAEIAKINFENYLIRQQLEEEEQMRQNGEYEETKTDYDYGNEDERQSAGTIQEMGQTVASLGSPDKRKSKSRARKRAGKEYLKNMFCVNTSYCRHETETL